MVLKLQNNTDKTEYTLTGLTDTNLSQLYYSFNISFPVMPDGEYTYSLMEGTEVLASGLLQVGDYTPAETTTYNKEKQGFIQYNPN